MERGNNEGGGGGPTWQGVGEGKNMTLSVVFVQKNTFLISSQYIISISLPHTFYSPYLSPAFTASNQPVSCWIYMQLPCWED
jgi:hypothetical protein